MKIKNLICSVCKDKDEPFVSVCCVPGVPISMTYCRKCLHANAHPWGILVANTACANGYDNTAEWWREMVLCTCKHLGRTLDEFKAEVEKNILAEREKMENLQREQNGNG